MENKKRKVKKMGEIKKQGEDGKEKGLMEWETERRKKWGW